jgi:hypothetical protein
MKNLFKNKYLIGTIISLVFASILIVLIRKKMGDEGLNRAQEFFSSKVYVKKIEGLYNSFF